MPNFRHVITDCIQSSRTGDRPDLHLTEAEKTYSDAAKNLDFIQCKLKDSEALFRQSSRYLKKLLRDEVAAKLEVPRLKKELIGLKEKLISLTFETERWETACRKQEDQIAVLHEKESALSQQLSKTKSNQQTIEKENSQLEKDRAELVSSIENIGSIRSTINIFDHIVHCEQPSAESAKLTSPDLVGDVNDIVAKIHSAQADKQQFDTQITEITASINNRQDKVDTTQQQIIKLSEDCSSKNEIISSLDSDIDALTEQVRGLQQRYQTYYEIITESTAVKEERNALIDTVNDENSNLKESLLTCNKLEMTLRLEELKMGVFLNETEGLNE